MATKNDIYSNLISQLQTIIAGGTYVITVGNVYRTVRGFSRAAENTPAVAIMEDREELLVEDATHKRYLLHLILFIEINRGSDIAETMTSFERDLKTLFETPIDLGASVLYSKIVEISAAAASDEAKYAAMNIPIEITYYEAI